MEDFREKYKSDTLDLVSNFMNEIIELETKPKDKYLIDSVFRAIHTIKGSATMFGFEKVGCLTHNLENIFDDIREDKISTNQEIINISLSVADIIQKLLHNNEILSEEDETNFNLLINKLTKYNSEKTEIFEEDNQSNESDDEYKLYYILFYPKEDVLKRGIKPFEIFEELLENGVYKAFPFTEKFNDLENIDVTDFFLYWEIFYLSKFEIDEVKDVFMFYYDDEYDITTIKIDDFFKKDEIFNKFKIINSGEISISNLQSAIKELLKQFEIQVVEEKNNIEEENLQSKTTTESQIFESIRVSSSKLDELINLVSELVTLNSGLEILAKEVGNEKLIKKVIEVNKLSKRFRDNALDLRLIPINVLIVKFKRLVRDLSVKLDKQIEIVIDGAETQLDKNIIDKIEAPLMHIIRNAIDHGIEDKEVRIENNKPEKGIIRLISFYSGANVFIQIQDDGKGIDLEKIRLKAIERKLISEEENLTENELLDLIFTPGFSTAQSLTDVSGRGVGMDVVRKQITDLRGEIDITTEKNLGTSVTLKLPLTLSIIDTLLVNVTYWKLLIPIYPVIACKRMKFNENDQLDRIEFMDKLIPVINLFDIFTSKFDYSEFKQVIVLNINEKHYGLLIDKVISEHQAVIKPLGHLHKNQSYLSGASILGDGSIVPVLDLNSMLKEFLRK